MTMQGFDIEKFNNALLERLRNPKSPPPRPASVPTIAPQVKQRILSPLHRTRQRRPSLNLGSIRGG